MAAVTGRQLTAPACRVLTVLHLVDPAAPWVQDMRGDGSTNGSTMCGLPMLTSESWQLLELLPGEKVCPRCTGDAADAEEEPLW